MLLAACSAVANAWDVFHVTREDIFDLFLVLLGYKILK